LQLEEEACELKSKIVTVPADLEADLHRLRDKKQELKAERQRLLELKQEKNRQKELHENFLQKQEKCIARLKDITALCDRLK
jgi:septal ring factor EnvC (AmiA/AmiB activator)